MSHISTLTYGLDAAGAFGLLAGGYVATKSTYSERVNKKAVELIGLQDSEIGKLKESISVLTKEVHKYREENNMMLGQLQAYKELSLVSPEIITKLTTTLDDIKKVLTK